MFSSPVVRGLSFNSGSETHKPRWDCVFITSVASSWFGNPGLGQLAQVLDWWPGMIWAGIDFPSNLRDVLPTTWPLTIQVHHTSLPAVSWNEHVLRVFIWAVSSSWSDCLHTVQCQLFFKSLLKYYLLNETHSDHPIWSYNQFLHHSKLLCFPPPTTKYFLNILYNVIIH